MALGKWEQKAIKRLGMRKSELSYAKKSLFHDGMKVKIFTPNCDFCKDSRRGLSSTSSLSSTDCLQT